MGVRGKSAKGILAVRMPATIQAGQGSGKVALTREKGKGTGRYLAYRYGDLGPPIFNINLQKLRFLPDPMQKRSFRKT